MPSELFDSIQVISDGINAINGRLADMLPTDGYEELEAKRDAALDRLHFLVKLFVKSSTRRFVDSNSELVQVNESMKHTLAELESMQQTLDSVKRFVSAIDGLISSIAQIV
jgi:hypothetical protein